MKRQANTQGCQHRQPKSTPTETVSANENLFQNTDKTVDSISVHALRSKTKASKGKQTTADNSAIEVKMRYAQKKKVDGTASAVKELKTNDMSEHALRSKTKTDICDKTVDHIPVHRCFQTEMFG